LKEDASASFFVLNYLAEFWAHIRSSTADRRFRTQVCPLYPLH
jgi:hypothetical protein